MKRNIDRESTALVVQVNDQIKVQVVDHRGHPVGNGRVAVVESLDASPVLGGVNLRYVLSESDRNPLVTETIMGPDVHISPDHKAAIFRSVRYPNHDPRAYNADILTLIRHHQN